MDPAGVAGVNWFNWAGSGRSAHTPCRVVTCLAAPIAGAPRPHLSHALVLFLSPGGVGVPHQWELKDFLCISLLGDLPVTGDSISHIAMPFSRRKPMGKVA